jgi:hypothetical protein
MNETFTREIQFLSNTFDGEKAVQVTSKKVATFKELSRTDKKQHDLHFEIVGLMVSNKIEDETEEDGEQKAKFKLDMSSVRGLVVNAIKTLLVVDANFTDVDKKEFLQDSGALLNFSLWFVPEKVTPFFSTLT